MVISSPSTLSRRYFNAHSKFSDVRELAQSTTESVVSAYNLSILIVESSIITSTEIFTQKSQILYPNTNDRYITQIAIIGTKNSFLIYVRRESIVLIEPTQQNEHENLYELVNEN